MKPGDGRTGCGAPQGVGSDPGFRRGWTAVRVGETSAECVVPVNGGGRSLRWVFWSSLRHATGTVRTRYLP